MTGLEDRVQAVIAAQPRYAGMQVILEKEILHQTILRALDRAGYLKGLVFMGGTALRLCYGAPRFSEDLDFEGGVDFTADRMDRLEVTLADAIATRFGLATHVRPPSVRQRQGATQTWRISIITRPERRDLARQHIHLDIGRLPAPHAILRPLHQHHPGGAAETPLQVRVKTPAALLADKIVACAATIDRPAPRWRDVWDITWLHTRGVHADPEQVAARARLFAVQDVPALLAHAASRIPQRIREDAFVTQMARFLDADRAARTIQDPPWRQAAGQTLHDVLTAVQTELRPPSPSPKPRTARAAPQSIAEAPAPDDSPAPFDPTPTPDPSPSPDL